MEVSVFLLIPVFLGAGLLGYLVAIGVAGSIMAERAELAEKQVEVMRRRMTAADINANFWEREAVKWRNLYYTTTVGPKPRSSYKPPPPPPPRYGPKHWRSILGFVGDSKVTRKEVRERYVLLAKRYHPDRGGSVGQMTNINVAKEEALRELVT